MVRHRFQTVWPVHVQRALASDNPWREDQIWVTDGVVGMKVRDEGGSQVHGPDRLDSSRSRGRRPPDNPRPQIDEVCAIIDGNRGRRSRMLRVRAWRASAE